VLHLDLCDHVLVMCLGGRMGYFGPPDELLPFFEAEDYADVFDKVTNDADRWAQRYRNSEVYRKYVGEVALELAAKDFKPLPDDIMPTPRPAPEQPLIVVGATAPDPATASSNGALGAAHDEPPTAAMAIATPAPMADLSAAPAAPAPDGVAPAPVAAPVAIPRPRKPYRPKSKFVAGVDRVAAVVFRDSKLAPPGKQKVVQEKSVTQQALHPVAPLRQFLTLCARMVAVIASDRGYSAFLIGLPLALGVLSQAVPGSKGLGPDPAGYSLEAQRRLVVLIIGAAFMGVAVAIREIINEASIYRRERAIGLSPTAYLASKVVIFLIIDAIQVFIFAEIALLRKPGPVEGLVIKSNGEAEILLMTWFVAITSTAIALLASALVRTTDQTTPILVVSVMFQLVLSGGLFAIEGQQFLEIFSVIDPSRWGFAGVAATTNLVNFPFPDPLWVHSVGNWWKATIILVLQMAVLIGGTRLALRRYEPGKG
jgi:hypothetical protein